MTFSIFLVDKKYLTFSIFLVVGVCGNLATCVVIVSNEYLRSESPPKVQYSTEPDFPKNTVTCVAWILSIPATMISRSRM